MERSERGQVIARHLSSNRAMVWDRHENGLSRDRNASSKRRDRSAQTNAKLTYVLLATAVWLAIVIVRGLATA